MYDVAFRKLALRMVQSVGVVKTAVFTSVSRSTLWRWQRYGVTPKKRRFDSKLFSAVKDALRAFLVFKPCSTAKQIIQHLANDHGTRVHSLKTVYRLIRMLGFTRKRAQWRGQTPASRQDALLARKHDFVASYHSALSSGRLIVSVDECAFSECVQPMYGYSPVGEPLILRRSGGGWTHYSLLQAVCSDGRSFSTVKKGAMRRVDVTAFLESLPIDMSALVVMDNASIHKRLDLVNPLSICYTPPYSPEYNAIELCFAYVKRCFRRANNGSESFDIENTINQSVNALPASVILSCFRHVEGIIRGHA